MSYIVNGAGAKIFSDINKNKKLDIPNLKNDSETGRVYTVLSVGFIGTHPLAHIHWLLLRMKQVIQQQGYYQKI